MKYSVSQNKRLQTAVKRYNAKLQREIKKNPDIVWYGPPKQSVKEIKKRISTPNELKREINSLNRLFNEGALERVITSQGVVTTKYEIEETRRKVQLINRRRKKQLEKLPEHPEYHGTMGTIEQNALKPRKYNPDLIKAKNWNKYVDIINKQVSDTYFDDMNKLYVANYHKALDNALGSYGQPIKDVLSFLSPEQIATAFYTNDMLHINYIYPKKGAKYNDLDLYETAEEIFDEWLKVLKMHFNTLPQNERKELKEKLMEFSWNSHTDINSWNINSKNKRKPNGKKRVKKK